MDTSREWILEPCHSSASIPSKVACVCVDESSVAVDVWIFLRELTMPSISGRCLCGAVKFKANDADDHFHLCHCGMCRRWATGPLMVVRASEPEFSGVENLTRYRSSEWAERGFCKQCGSSLFYFLVPAKQYFVSVGALDDSSALTLGSEFFIDHKPASYEIAGEHARLTEAEVLAKWS